MVRPLYRGCLYLRKSTIEDFTVYNITMEYLYNEERKGMARHKVSRWILQVFYTVTCITESKNMVRGRHYPWVGTVQRKNILEMFRDGGGGGVEVGI